MFVAAVLQRTMSTTAPKSEVIAGSYIGLTAEDAASLAEDFAANMRKQNNAAKYRVVVGKMTHEIEPPEKKVILKPLVETT